MQVRFLLPLLARKGGNIENRIHGKEKGVIFATVNKGEVSCKIEGRGIQILSETTVLVDSILDAMAKDGDIEKAELVNLVCRGLNHINEREN